MAELVCQYAQESILTVVVSRITGGFDAPYHGNEHSKALNFVILLAGLHCELDSGALSTLDIDFAKRRDDDHVNSVQ